MSQVMILFTMKMLWVSFDIVLYSFYGNFYVEEVSEKSPYFSKTKPKIYIDLLICFRTESYLQYISKEKKNISLFNAYLSISTLSCWRWYCSVVTKHANLQMLNIRVVWSSVMKIHTCIKWIFLHKI
jgi:hypothetical protein